MISNKVVTTVRMPKELHDYLFSEVRWTEKKSVGKIIIESINEYLTKRGYKIK